MSIVCTENHIPPANSNARSSPSLESLSNRMAEIKVATCYNLCERWSVAIANLHFRCDWSGDWGVLLFSAGPPEGRSRRLWLDPSSSRASAGAAKSLRHSTGAISSDLGVFWIAVGVAAPGGRRGSVLWRQFRFARVWRDPVRLSSFVDFPGISLLGGPAGGPVVYVDRCQRLPPATAARHHGQAPGGFAGCDHLSEPARNPGLCGGRLA